MPWLSSGSPSPQGSPRMSSPPQTSSEPSVTYIPPLIDGACGSLPQVHQSPIALLRGDARRFARRMPVIARAAWTNYNARRKETSWRDMGEMALQMMVSGIEMYALVSLVPLWLCLPGALFCAWLALCMTLVMGICRMLNGDDEVIRYSATAATGSESFSMGPELEDERWIFIGGMGTSSRTLAKSTLPKVSKLFNRPITAVQMFTWGLPFDLLAMIMQRSLGLSSSASQTLYNQLRVALLDTRLHRVVVLAHNQGAVTTSQVLSRLYADVPSEKLARLEIYTFGSLASEFVIPVGDPKPAKEQNGQHDFVAERREPHIEHFAHASDPWAQLGVIRSVKEDLEGRYCGGVFVINNYSGKTTSGKKALVPAMQLEDYLRCLFPTPTKQQQLPFQQPPSPISAPGSPISPMGPPTPGVTGIPGFTSMTGPRSILDSIMAIDREVAEKREFTAMANHPLLTRGGKDKKKRLSWTGLGAMAGGRNGIMDGVRGLEMARKGCKDCDGHRGREVSWLVRYVNIGQYMMDPKEMMGIRPEGPAMGRMQ